jgi:cytosine/adenosine deaminase-related metal-dependent hydrolase
MLRLALLLLGPVFATAAPLIVRHVNLVDLRSATILRDRWVRIDEGRITAVGNSFLLVPRDATVLDARGKFLMPGLIGVLDRAAHQLVALGITAVRHRGPMPENEHAAPRLIDADPLATNPPLTAPLNDRRRAARALRAITLDAVAGTSFEGQLGRIAPGYLADLILLTANPLEDVGRTSRLAGVILDGRLLDRRDLDKLYASR